MEINKSLGIRVAEPIPIHVRRLQNHLTGADEARQMQLQIEKMPVRYPYRIHEDFYTRNGKLVQTNTTVSYYV